MEHSRRMFIGASLAAAGSARVIAQPAPKQAPPVDLRDFGAVGDGITDNRAAFAAAVAAGRGRRIAVPQGNYRIDADGGSITLEEVDLVGEGVLDGATGSIDRGANLWVTGAANSPFKVRRGVSVQGLGIYYPDQSDSANPRPYPATFAFDFTAPGTAVQYVQFLRNVVYNAYRFIEIGDPRGNVGHVEIIGNYICALNRAIYLKYNAEHVRIERNNFTFSHWHGSTESGARGYMRANATAVEVDRSDGIEFVDNLIFGHLNGLLCSATGLCQYLKVSENKFDQVRYGVRAIGPGNFDGQLIGNTFNSFNPRNRALQGRSFSIETAGPKTESITVASNNFDAAAGEHIYVAGDNPVRKIVIGPNNYRLWGSSTGIGAAINANGARTDVQLTGGWFYGDNGSRLVSYGLLGDLQTLQLTGAAFEGCFAALKVRANQVIATGNLAKSTTGPTSDLISAPVIVQSGNHWDKPAATGGGAPGQ